VAEVDGSVGQILDKLTELKIDERTLVVFLSDNGGSFFKKMKLKFSSNAPFNGGKATPAEGGFRTPTLAWWPGTIEAGSVTGLMAAAMDLLPTFASLSGEPFKPQRPIDGLDISGLFRNPLPPTSPRKTFVYYAYHVEPDRTDQTLLYAVREGRWKYYLKPTRFLIAGTSDYLEVPQGALFDLDTNPTETNNLAPNHRDVVKDMLDLAESYIRELGDAGRTGEGVRQAGFVNEATPMRFSH